MMESYWHSRCMSFVGVDQLHCEAHWRIRFGELVVGYNLAPNVVPMWPVRLPAAQTRDINGDA